MPFEKKCATEQLHEDWKCPQGGKLLTKVASSVKRKLLELVSKTEETHYHRGSVKFCVAKISELYPDLVSVSATSSSSSTTASASALDFVSEDSPPPPKTRRIEVAALSAQE